MAHSSELNWQAAAGLVSEAAAQILVGLDEAESIYQDLFEVYQYVGAADQDFADQLFVNQWSVRTTPGVQAVVTVDVVAGLVENPQITNGGTGYDNGFNQVVTLYGTAGGGVVLATVYYDVIGGVVANVRLGAPGSSYTDGIGTTVLELPAPTVGIPETQASAEEVAKVTDLRAAITALHDLYQAMNDGVVSQADRAADLRRMS